MLSTCTMGELVPYVDQNQYLTALPWKPLYFTRFGGLLGHAGSFLDRPLVSAAWASAFWFACFFSSSFDLLIMYLIAWHTVFFIQKDPCVLMTILLMLQIVRRTKVSVPFAIAAFTCIWMVMLLARKLRHLGLDVRRNDARNAGLESMCLCKVNKVRFKDGRL